MQTVKQSDPRAAHRRVFFTAVDQAALQTRLQSSDMSTFSVFLTKVGATPALVAAGAPVQVGVTNAKGLFYVELALADVDVAGPATLVVTNTGGTKTMEKREISFYIEPAFFTTVVTGLNTTSFTSDRAEGVDNFWKDVYASVLTGSLAGQVKKIGGYAGSSKVFSLASGFQFTAPLGVGDVVEIINR
jgi:hypothetical protein